MKPFFEIQNFMYFLRNRWPKFYRKFERKLKRIDPINNQIKKIISIKSSLVDRWSIKNCLMGSENERDLYNPGYDVIFVFGKQNSWPAGITLPFYSFLVV